MGLVTLQSVTIGAALLLICCGDPEAKARRLLNQAQALEREGGNSGSLGGRWWVNMKLNHSQLCV